MSNPIRRRHGTGDGSGRSTIADHKIDEELMLPFICAAIAVGPIILRRAASKQWHALSFPEWLCLGLAATILVPIGLYRIAPEFGFVYILLDLAGNVVILILSAAALLRLAWKRPHANSGWMLDC